MLRLRAGPCRRGPPRPYLLDEENARMNPTPVLPTPARRRRGTVILIALAAACAILLAVALSSTARATNAAQQSAVEAGSPAALTWQLQAPVTGEDLRDVFMLAENDVWAVGNAGTVLHFDGSTWSPVPISTTDTLRDIYMVSPTMGFIVAWSGGGSTIWHWDGAAWTQRGTIPDPLYRLDANSATDAWASGVSVVYHWNGTDWSLHWNAPSVLFAIDMTSADTGWAVGAYGTIVQYDSGVWSQYVGSPVGNVLYETYFTSPTDGWAVGFTQTTYLLHNNGETWTRRYTLPFPVDRIRMFSSNSGWVTGGLNIAYFDGRSFRQAANPATHTLTALSMVSASSGWIVGEQGTLLRLVDDGTPTPTPTSCPLQFQDVPGTNTFYPFVRCLSCQGVISGYACGGTGEPCGTTGDPYFRPNNQVTRGQLAKIVSQSAGFNNAIEPARQAFEDVPPGSTFWDPVEQLAYLGVMGGYACGGPGEPCVPPENRPYFRPGNNATRGQLAKIVANAADYGTVVPPAEYTFADVQPDSTFWMYVERLLANRPGAMSGYPCGGPGEPCDALNRAYFRPNNHLTRGQTSKIVSSTFFPGCNPR
jgi:photosystem II stability/assembly factor-like uncharacterized protein